MKKIRSYTIGIILIFAVFLSPKLVNAQQIQNTGVTLKNSSNTGVLYSGGINEDQTNIAYVTGKVEFPFSTSVAYDSSYSFTMDYYFNVPYTSDHSSFGWGNPELYILSTGQGLVQQGVTISSFSNTLQACNVLACTYRLNLAFTFATNASGTLYLAIPVSPPHAIYGWHYNNIDLTSYGQNTSNSDIINNNNQNTQNIISNNNQNTQNIINNQNNNTQQIIESNKVCTLYDGNKIKFNHKMLDSTGDLQNNNLRGVSDFIHISSTDTLKTLVDIQSSDNIPYKICFYDSTQSYISCIDSSTIDITIPSSSAYVRFTFNNSNLQPKFSLCGNGNQNLDNAINNLNDSINDKNIDNAMDNGSEFFDNFNHDSHGLSGIITSPIRLLNSLTTAQCSPLKFNLPFVHNEVTLACPRTMYESYFGVFFSLWQLITTGLITYNVCINIYHKIHMMQNPYSDRIEVLNL